MSDSKTGALRFSAVLDELLREAVDHQQLNAKYEPDTVTYGMLLTTSEWKRRRAQILARDEHRCQTCKKNTVQLEVHHKRYIQGRLPWDYPDDELVTMCMNCHMDLHNSRDVYVYQEVDGLLIRKEEMVCRKCHGAGWFPEYRHRDNGVCYRCWGSGMDIVLKGRTRSIIPSEEERR